MYNLISLSQTVLTSGPLHERWLKSATTYLSRLFRLGLLGRLCDFPKCVSCELFLSPPGRDIIQ
jgi:hypothetical protein